MIENTLKLTELIAKYHNQDTSNKEGRDTQIDIMYQMFEVVRKQFETDTPEYNDIAQDIALINTNNIIFDRFYLLELVDNNKINIDFLLTQFNFFDNSRAAIDKDLAYTNSDWSRLYSVGFEHDKASFEELAYEVISQRMIMMAKIAIKFNDLDLLQQALTTTHFTHNAQQLFLYNLSSEAQKLVLKTHIKFSKKILQVEEYTHSKRVEEKERSALYGAISFGNSALVKELIKRGSDVNWRYLHTKFTYKQEPFTEENLALSKTYPLDDHMQQAIRAGDYEIAKILIDNGFKFDIGNAEKVNYLAKLIQMHNYQYMHYGRMLNNQDPKNYPKLVKLLLNNGQSLEVESLKEIIKDQTYPQFLLEYFDLDILSQQDWNDIFYELAQSDDISLLEHLIQTGNKKYLKKVTNGYYSYNQKLEKFLLKHKIITLKNIHTRTLENAMYYIEDSRNPNSTLKADFLVEYLLTAEYIDIGYSEEGRSFLSFFAAFPTITTQELEAFIHKLQEQNKFKKLIKTQKGGVNILFWIERGAEKMQLLIDYGADPSLIDDQGRSLAMYVKNTQTYEVIRKYASEAEQMQRDCYFYVAIDNNKDYQHTCKAFASTLPISHHKIFTLFLAGEFEEIKTITQIDEVKSYVWIAFAYALTGDIKNAAQHYKTYQSNFDEDYTDKGYFEQSLEGVKNLYGKDKQELVEKILILQDATKIAKFDALLSSVQKNVNDLLPKMLQEGLADHPSVTLHSSKELPLEKTFYAFALSTMIYEGNFGLWMGNTIDKTNIIEKFGMRYDIIYNPGDMQDIGMGQGFDYDEMFDVYKDEATREYDVYLKNKLLEVYYLELIHFTKSDVFKSMIKTDDFKILLVEYDDRLERSVERMHIIRQKHNISTPYDIDIKDVYKYKEQ